MTGFWLISYITLWLLFLIIAVALLSVLHNLGVIYESIKAQRIQQVPSKLSVGDSLPEVTLPTLGGEMLSTSALLGDKAAFLVVSPTCSPCHEHLRTLATAQTTVDPLDPDLRHFAVISVGDGDRTRHFIERVGLSREIPVFLDTDSLIAIAWGTTATPTTVIVDAQMKVVRQVFGFPGTAGLEDNHQPVFVGSPEPASLM